MHSISVELSTSLTEKNTPIIHAIQLPAKWHLNDLCHMCRVSLSHSLNKYEAHSTTNHDFIIQYHA